MITASGYREVVRNTLQGFITLTLSPSGILLKECTYHVRPDGRRWVGLPSKPQIDADGRHRKDPASGKALYTSIVEISGKAERERFEKAGIEAIDKLLGRGTP